MYSNDIKPYLNKVVTLDLVSGLQITAEVKDVDDVKISLKRPVVFQISTEPADPSAPPSPTNPIQQKLHAVPYGGPLVRPEQDRKFDLSHIMGVHTPIDALEKAYMQATSGIQVAGAGTLNDLEKNHPIRK